MTGGNEPGHSIIMRNAASQRTGASTSVIEIERPGPPAQLSHRHAAGRCDR